MWCRYNLDSFQSGLVVSSSLFGALAGSSAAFVVGDKLGRRRELMLAAVLYGELPFRSQSPSKQVNDNLTGCYRPFSCHIACLSTKRSCMSTMSMNWSIC